MAERKAIMAKGTVNKFEKTYGFITCEDGSEVFVHFTGIVGDGFKKLEVGDSVEFDIVPGKEEGKPQASNVRKI